MKSKLKCIITTAIITFNNLFFVYADEEPTRMDKQLLAGICVFLRSASYLMLVFGIGMLIYSIKETDGAKKVESLKLFGLGLILYISKNIAEVFNLI